MHKRMNISRKFHDKEKRKDLAILKWSPKFRQKNSKFMNEFCIQQGSFLFVWEKCSRYCKLKVFFKSTEKFICVLERILEKYDRLIGRPPKKKIVKKL